uniref:Saposin B-type domain-containing protein n=1 Tax=Ditylenchus dipsaci TaxID=166011 RepID=A0A915E5Y0_9BILA
MLLLDAKTFAVNKSADDFVTNSPHESEPNDCKSCMTVFVKLAGHYFEKKPAGEPDQFISNIFEKECIKQDFQKPAVSCLLILEEVNRLDDSKQNFLADLTNLNEMFAVCQSAVQGVLSSWTCKAVC